LGGQKQTEKLKIFNGEHALKEKRREKNRTEQNRKEKKRMHTSLFSVG